MNVQEAIKSVMVYTGVAFLVFALSWIIWESNQKPELSNNYIPCTKLDLSPAKVDLSLQKQTKYERARLVEAVYHECREKACPELERFFIVDTILQRTVVGHRGSKSIRQTIESPKQFSYLNGVPSRQVPPNPKKIGDVQELLKIEELVRQSYLNYLFGNENKDHFQVLQTKSIQYYNPAKTDGIPNWVDEKCRIPTPSNFIHRFYTCYKLK